MSSSALRPQNSDFFFEGSEFRHSVLHQVNGFVCVALHLTFIIQTFSTSVHMNCQSMACLRSEVLHRLQRLSLTCILSGLSVLHCYLSTLVQPVLNLLPCFFFLCLLLLPILHKLLLPLDLGAIAPTLNPLTATCRAQEPGC
jgi:hypothetical protein